MTWNEWLEAAAEKYRREQDGDCTPKGSKAGEHPYLFCECDMEKAFADGARAALQSPVMLDLLTALRSIGEFQTNGEPTIAAEIALAEIKAFTAATQPSAAQKGEWCHKCGVSADKFHKCKTCNTQKGGDNG